MKNNKTILSIGNYDKKIRNLKLQLLKLGYGKNLFPIDNWFDNNLYEIIVDFQLENKLPISGKYDAFTKEKIEETINT